jgi:hypothetical protein
VNTIQVITQEQEHASSEDHYLRRVPALALIAQMPQRFGFDWVGQYDRKGNAIAERDGCFSWLLDLVALIYLDDSTHWSPGPS